MWKGHAVEDCLEAGVGSEREAGLIVDAIVPKSDKVCRHSI
jgi:hypothetical protein